MRVCLSGSRGAGCGRLPGQGRARSAKRVLSCPREGDTGTGSLEGVHITKRGASLRQHPLLDISTRISIIGGHWLPAVITL